tara:strand:- start:4363 stop:4575 length:213 start_codon:yes stop_codon:yes gene_type:complete
MKNKITNITIILLIAISFVVACFNTTNGIFFAVFTNTILNYISFLRQKSTNNKVKKRKVLTVDEFRKKTF